MQFTCIGFVCLPTQCNKSNYLSFDLTCFFNSKFTDTSYCSIQLF